MKDKGTVKKSIFLASAMIKYLQLRAFGIELKQLSNSNKEKLMGLNRSCLNIVLSLICLLFIGCTKKTEETAQFQIVCNKFKLVTEVTDATLSLSIDTDLPDNTVVMVDVYRTYLQKGKSEKYVVDYFSEKSTVGKWKSKYQISIASEAWRNKLRNRQEELPKFGLGFEVDSISDYITANMTIPINQPDPKFGERNLNLTGKAVIKTDKEGNTITGEVVGWMHNVRDEIQINYPLDSPYISGSLLPSLYPLKLDIGQTYIVSSQTPLMPSVNPDDPMEAISQIKQIPKGGVFKVHEMAENGNTPWYRVTAFDQKKQQLGKGWINSTALLGQDLKADK